MVRLLIAMTCLCALIPAQGSAEDAYHFAAGLHDRGMHERAVRAFKQFVREHGQSERIGEAWFFMGQSLVACGRDDEALPCFERVVSLAPKKVLAAARLRQGELLQRAGRDAEALRALAPLQRVKDEKIREAALYFRAEAHLGNGSPKEAELAFEELLKTFPRSRYAAYSQHGLGYILHGRNEPDRAGRRFIRARELAGKDKNLATEAGTMAGRCYLRSKDARRALDIFDAVLKNGEGDRHDAALGRADALFALGRHEDATNALQAAARRRPDDERTQRALLRGAASLHEAGQNEQGMRLLSAVSGVSGDLARDLAYWKGRLMGASGNMQGSIEELRAAAVGSPRRQFSLGDALSRAGRHEEAAGVFAGVVKSAKDRKLRQEAMFAQAFAFNQAGRHAEAVRVLAQMDREKLPADLRYDRDFAMAENLFTLKKYGEALAWYERVAAVPGGGYASDARYKIAWSRYLTKDYKKAIAALRVFLSQGKDEALLTEARYLIGKCHEALGDKDAAQKAFGELARNTEDVGYRVRALLGAAGAARNRGDLESAIKSYRTALDSAQDETLIADGLLGLAETLHDAGRTDHAAKAYALFIERYSEDQRKASAELGRAWCLRSGGDHAAAKAAADRATQHGRSPEEVGEAIHLAALSARSEGDHEGALTRAEKFLRELGGHARTKEVRLIAGLSCAALKRHSKAIDLLSPFLQSTDHDENRATALYELAFSYEALERPADRDRTLAVLAQEHEKSPLAADASFRLGEAAYERKQWKKAIGHYDRASALAADAALRTKALYKGAWSHRQLQNHDAAAARFEKVSESEDEAFSGEATYLAADAHVKAGRIERARSLFARMGERHARHELAADAACRVVLCDAESGNHAQVRRLAPSVIARHAKHPRLVSVWSALGDALFAEESWDRARRAFASVTGLSDGPLGARAQFKIGMALKAQGRTDEAVDALLKVLILYSHPEWSPRASWEAAGILEANGQENKARKILTELVRDHPQSEQAKQAAKKIGR